MYRCSFFVSLTDGFPAVLLLVAHTGSDLSLFEWAEAEALVMFMFMFP